MYIGVFIDSISLFFPFSSSSGSNTDTSNYIHGVFCVVPGVLAITGFLVVLFFHRYLLFGTKKGSYDLAMVNGNFTAITAPYILSYSVRKDSGVAEMNQLRSIRI